MAKDANFALTGLSGLGGLVSIDRALNLESSDFDFLLLEDGSFLLLE